MPTSAPVSKPSSFNRRSDNYQRQREQESGCRAGTIRACPRIWRKCTNVSGRVARYLRDSFPRTAITDGESSVTAVADATSFVPSGEFRRTVKRKTSGFSQKPYPIEAPVDRTICRADTSCSAHADRLSTAASILSQVSGTTQYNVFAIRSRFHTSPASPSPETERPPHDPRIAVETNTRVSLCIELPIESRRVTGGACWHC